MVERTPDGRYIIVDGRRWRATDPDLDEDVRDRLVRELMAARRAVKSAKTSEDAKALLSARARVQDAKVALGERGTPWWEPATTEARAERKAATDRALARPEKNGHEGNEASQI